MLSALIAAGSGAQPVSVAGIADAAGVSRQFIYDHPDLLKALRRVRDSKPSGVVTPSSSTQEMALRAELESALSKLRRLEQQKAAAAARVADLEVIEQKWLGTQVDALLQPGRLPELIAENEALTRRLLETSRLLEARERTIARLEEELRISRLAHEETAAALHTRMAGLSSLKDRRREATAD